MAAKDKFLVALDVDSGATARSLANSISDLIGGVKVGSRLFTLEGPSLVRHFVNQGIRVFLDLKYHDIPNTVAQAVEAAAELGVYMLNVHALGGPKMIRAAREALDKHFLKHGKRPLLIAVTILTSHDEDELELVGIPKDVPINMRVAHLAVMAHAAGADGVVCSPQEIETVRRAICDEAFIVVTPGIRLAGAEKNDQQRTDTPAEARRRGASYIIVGRPIIGAEDKRAAAKAFSIELQSAEAEQA